MKPMDIISLYYNNLPKVYWEMSKYNFNCIKDSKDSNGQYLVAYNLCDSDVTLLGRQIKFVENNTVSLVFEFPDGTMIRRNYENNQI